MGRDAYQLLRPKKRSRWRVGNRCRTKLNALRIRCQCHIDSIIDEESGTVGLTEPARLFSQQEQVAPRQILLSELNGFDPAVERLLQNPEEVSPAGLIPIGYQVKLKISRSHS